MRSLSLMIKYFMLFTIAYIALWILAILQLINEAFVSLINKLKNEINKFTDSEIREVKDYVKYQ